MSIKAEDNIMLESKKPIYDIAANTDQYFWHTETGADTGAHITEIPKEDFLDDPANGGYNLLARSNGMAVRDGLTELARFTANGVQIGADNDVHGVFTSNALEFYSQTTKCAELSYSQDLNTSNWKWFLIRQQQNNVSSTFGRGILLAADNGITNQYMYRYIGSTLKLTANEGFDLNYLQSDYQPDSSIRGSEGGIRLERRRSNNISGALRLRYNETNDVGTYLGTAITMSMNSGFTRSYIEIIADDIYVRGTFYNYSDKKIKEHIKYLDEDAYGFVRSLKPALYRYKSNEVINVGFYAQDVEEVDPWDCTTATGDDGMKMLSYEEIIAPLVAYCQHLEERIKRLEK